MKKGLLFLTASFPCAIVGGGISAPDEFKAVIESAASEGTSVFVTYQVPKSEGERSPEPWGAVTKTITQAGNRLDTQNNKVGIQEGDVCALVTYLNTTEVVCTSGHRFEVVTQKSSITGTPGYLKDGYVGTYISRTSTSGMSGSGKRVNVFKK